MAQRRSRAAEHPSPNTRPRQQSRISASDVPGPASNPPASIAGADATTTPPALTAGDQSTTTPPASTAGGQSSTTPPASNAGGQDTPGIPAADTSMLQQLFVMMSQQNQTFLAAIQAQMHQTQAQMHQAQAHFEQMMLQQGSRSRKKDPPVYEGKISEDLELWIFATDEYYASSRAHMDAGSSEFVTMISSNLGKTVLNSHFFGSM
ncbi:unnamed protein product [Phytophthora fragariaefolia]|uniref:Unnamed protein product n=1 Tax=Phytophthora fragariaefolia TaxID=1490495 RepID=A0A9W6TMV6_9STRA|nr:unnamed protein product [Phytophthora fragariaefolia]